MTDNGANMVAAVHKAGWRHHPCFVHTLNLVVKDSVKSVPEMVQVLEKCSVIVSPQHKRYREAQGYSATVESGRTQANSVSRYLLELCLSHGGEALLAK